MREGEEESLDGDFMDFTRLRFPGEIETRARGLPVSESRLSALFSRICERKLLVDFLGDGADV